MSDTRVEFDNVSIVFGDQPERALPLMDEGRSRAEILAFFQERYGDWILLDPPRTGVLLLVWLLPVGFLVAGRYGQSLIQLVTLIMLFVLQPHFGIDRFAKLGQLPAKKTG